MNFLTVIFCSKKINTYLCIIKITIEPAATDKRHKTMKTTELYSKIKELGINAEMTSMFSYHINKDKRFNLIQVFDKPSVKLISLCDSYGCQLIAQTLNRRNASGQIEQVVTYDIYPVNLNDIDYIV